MTQQANPFDAMGQSFNALQGSWDQRTRNQAGRAYAAGDVEGATNAFAMGGMMPEATQMRTQQRADEQRQRSGRMTDALRGGDYEGAQAFAQTPDELQALQAFKQNASEQEIAAATRRAGQFAAIGQGLRGIPDLNERLRQARNLAPQHGIDPNEITLEMVDDAALDSFIMRSMGTVEFFKYQDREADNQRWQIVPGVGAIPPVGYRPPAQGDSAAPEYVDQLPQGVRPRPNQAPSAPAAGGAERSQTPRVSFRSSDEARQNVTRLVPGVTVTNADRTPADTARLRRQGYNPSDTSFHLQGQALDLVPPRGMSMAQLETKMRQAGFRVLNEGNHIHVSW